MSWSHVSMRMCRARVAQLGAALLLFVLSAGTLRPAAGQDAGVEALLKRGRKAGGADAEQMQRVAQRARQVGLSEGGAASLLRPAVGLSEQGFPAGPLLSKTLEGLAKRVPPARMRMVLREQRTSVEQAGQLVNQWTQRSDTRALLGTSEATPGETQKKARARLITAGAEAVRQGVSTEDLDAFLSGLSEGIEHRQVSLKGVATAVNVLSDLAGTGTSPKTARQLLTSALNAGYGPESLRQLPPALKSAHQKGKRPVGAVARGAAQAIAKSTPAATVLQSLFQGGRPGGGPPAEAGPPGGTPGTGKPPGAGPSDDPGPPDDPPNGEGPGLP